ncbi:MAG: 6,7-dimethyl-8-ribityllumazine synthase [Acidobacteriota bacterium]
MNDIRESVGNLDGRGQRFAIVASRFNERLVEELVRGAIDALLRHGVAASDIHLVRVPGAWEIPAALERLATTEVDGLIALGIVIRGETPHFDYVCSRVNQGCGHVADHHGIAVGFGVLTCETTAQAEARSGGKAGNKGREAALAALEMSRLLPQLGTSP